MRRKSCWRVKEDVGKLLVSSDRYTKNVGTESGEQFYGGRIAKEQCLKGAWKNCLPSRT